MKWKILEKHKYTKKFLCCLLVMGFSLCLTGCDGTNSLTEWCDTYLPEQLSIRRDANIKILENYVTENIISEEAAKEIKKSINNTADDLIKKSKKASDAGDFSMLGNIVGAVSKYTVASAEGAHPSFVKQNEKILDFGDPDGDGENYTYYHAESGTVLEAGSWNETGDEANDLLTDIGYYIVPNYLNSESFNSSATEGEVSREGKVSPIYMVPENSIGTFNNFIRCQVYVLRSEAANNGDLALDGVIAKIKDAFGSGMNDKDKLAQLANYFEPALDENGDPIYYIPENYPDYQMIVESTYNPSKGNVLGYDMALSQDDFRNCMYVRFVEFSANNFNNITRLKTDNTDAYEIIADPESGWRAYLIEYPISVVDTFEYGDTDVKVNFRQSGLGVNLVDGTTVKYKQTGLDESGQPEFNFNERQVIETDNPYLNFNTADNENAESVSSFILKGYDEMPIYDKAGTKYDIQAGRIILRDYLELTFAPECVEGEDLVVFGRKIRLNMTDWSKGEQLADNMYQQNLTFKLNSSAPIAEFVDQAGVKIPNSKGLYVTDFCDVASLQKDDYDLMKVVTLKPANLENDNKAATLTEGKLPDISNLEHLTVETSIRPVAMFPSEDIGSSDYRDDVTADSKQRFYCIATKYGIFDSSGLYSDWLNSTSTTASLSWWNAYLVSENFTYNVGNSRVADYLVGNYRYEIEGDLGIIIDLGTVAKIQEEYEQASITDTIRFINTLFIIVGWLLIIYGFILILAWVLDTTADLGIKLMEKLTFGHWVAVQYAEDLPRNPMDEITYLTAPGLAIKCIIIMSAGVILLTVNVFDIVLVLIELFGGIAQGAEKILKGLT
ncbi:MAG: hypothetical protein IKY94_05305 [Lachnospiraceae bacterium]|nr:hypothetical protein [Lachnospiraceae bacterium]